MSLRQKEWQFGNHKAATLIVSRQHIDGKQKVEQ
jgi:hypothetical protein